jgi:hypothetical protein
MNEESLLEDISSDTIDIIPDNSVIAIEYELSNTIPAPFGKSP